MGALTSTLHLLRATTLSSSISPTYLHSRTLTLINPQTYKYLSDTISLTLHASQLSTLDDTAVLALFTRGFFGGWASRLESLFMRAGGYKFLPPNFTGLPPTAAQQIWSPSALPSSNLVPGSSTVVGSFQVVDSHIASPTHLPTHPSVPPQIQREYSYIDFAFGSSTASFAGCHRFIVQRIRAPAPDLAPDPQLEETKGGVKDLEVEDEEGDEEKVEIRLEGYNCNPIRDGGSWAERISWFHQLYARLLFVGDVASVLRGAEAEMAKKGV